MNPTQLIFFIIGLWVGGIINALWFYKWAYLDARGRRRKPLGKYKHPILAIFEHYHWATILYIIAFRIWTFISPFLIGVATILFLDECLSQQHRFSLGSDHFKESILVEALILVGWMLIEVARALLLTIF